MGEWDRLSLSKEYLKPEYCLITSEAVQVIPGA